MPRNGSHIYARPPGTDGVPDATILSAAYNTNVADVEQDLNTPRPIVAGGTGATSPSTARTALNVPVAMVKVANYDSQVWETGSFWSDTTATGAPLGGHTFAGDAVVPNNDQDYVVLRAFDIGDSVTPGQYWVRQKFAGVWGGWAPLFEPIVEAMVAKSGDTMTGDLAIQKDNPTLVLQDASGSTTARIQHFGPTGAHNWELAFNPTDFEINGFDGSTGAFLFTSINIDHATGQANMESGLGVDEFLNLNGNFNCGGLINQGSVAVASSGANNITIGHINTRYGMTFQSDAPNSYPALFNNSSGVAAGNIFVGTTSTAYNTTSDARLKEDMRPVLNSGQVIDETRVWDFRWKATGERAVGVLAQDAVGVFPSAFTHDKIADYWSVDYARYVPLLLQELKDLRARVAELEGR